MSSPLTRPARADYAFPFAIDTPTGRTAQAGYEAHIDQMIRQLLLTDPGERVNRPSFGCGLRRTVFRPLTPGIGAATEILIRQSLDEFLAGLIEINSVTVVADDPTIGERGDGAIVIAISYTLLDTLAATTTQVRLT